MKPDYYSFLLKIWAQNPQNDEIHWRASLQSPKSGELINFKDLTELSSFLEMLVVGSSSKNSGNEKGDSTKSEDGQT